jgi:trk system potassium uptake protein TrkA
MKAVIVGCGRVGATLADQLDRTGHQVVILDIASAAFDRLPATFGGSAIRGDGTDEDVLRRAGTEGADVFLALTEGDNRNVMAAQLASEALGVGRVVAKINDPLRAEAYGHLGIASLCRTNLMTDAVLDFLGFQQPPRPGVIPPERPHHDHARSGAAPAVSGSVTGSGSGAHVHESTTASPGGTSPDAAASAVIAAPRSNVEG